MWKYKLSCPFGGYGEAVLILAALSMVLGVPLIIWAESMDIPAEFLAFGFALPMLPVLLIAFGISNFRTKEDRQKLRSAQPLQWERLSLTDVEKLRDSDFGMDKCFGYGMVLLMTGYVALASFHTKEYKLGLICIGLFAVVGLFAWHELYFWTHPDESAEIAVLPVDHYYTVYGLNTERSRRVIDEYAILVCYLPDGKYRFRMKANQTPPDAVRLIRNKKRVKLWLS